MHKKLKATTPTERYRALTISTIAFTVCFAVWTIFSIIGIKIKTDLNLSNTEFGLLISIPILMGSISRIFLGIWTDQFGGRLVYTILMIVTAIATWLLTSATTYTALVISALFLGLAGGSFAVGIAYVSRWFPKERQGTALGIYGAGNVGSAITHFCAPLLLVAFGWQGVAKIYALILLVMAIVFWCVSQTDPAIRLRQQNKQKPPPIKEQIKPLKNLQVWRFSLYYFFVFGGFVALALWLPMYYVKVYHLPIAEAGLFTAMYALPGSLFRVLGGWLSDKVGARKVMYWTFISCAICCFILSYPSTDYVVHGMTKSISFHLSINLYFFLFVTIILGFFMSLGKAAVYKHIPVYYPKNVGSVGGLVGLIGGLGGFILPICFGVMNDVVHIWTSCFMLLFLVIMTSLIWMHFSIRILERKKHPELNKQHYLPELDH